MNLVFIHGAGEIKKSSEKIRDQWLDGLREGLGTRALSLPVIDKAVAPFYAPCLNDGAVIDGRVISHGTTEDDPRYLRFRAAFLARMALRSGISEADLLAADPSLIREKGPLESRGVRVFAKAMVTHAPGWMSKWVIERNYEDVWLYLSRTALRRAVNRLVRESIPPGPCVIVAHSLGTVVAYEVLRQATELDVRLWVTAGSPLGLPEVKEQLEHPLGTPTCVKRWLNVSDRDDPVALFERLDEATFALGARIENMDDINNEDQPHAIERYLKDERVARAIGDALAG